MLQGICIALLISWSVWGVAYWVQDEDSYYPRTLRDSAFRVIRAMALSAGCTLFLAAVSLAVILLLAGASGNLK